MERVEDRDRGKLAEPIVEELFTNLSRAVEGAPTIALSAAFVWGILSIILSPCHLASIPLIVGFISGQGRMSAARASGIAMVFATGILITIAIVGAITAAAGRMLGDVGRWANYFLALVFFVAGLYLLGVFSLTWSAPQKTFKRKGLLAALMLGLVFGIALGPCTFAYMAPMLAVTFALGTTDPVYSASLLLAYGVGHCAVIALAGTFTTAVQRAVDWNEESKGMTLMKQACGVLVIFGGLWLIYIAR